MFPACQEGAIFACIQLILSYVKSSDKFAAEECYGKTSFIHNTEHYNKEYKLFNVKATYDEAVDQCRSWGNDWKSINGRLVTIPDYPAQSCLREMIKSEGNYNPLEWRGEATSHIGYFVGGTSNRTDWKWQNGKPVFLTDQTKGYSNWGDNEPRSRQPGKKCMGMVMHDEDHKVGEWVEHPCQERMFFICERDIHKSRVWGYENNEHATSPSKWAEIREEYKSCNGNRQSPIAIEIGPRRPCPNNIEGRLMSWENHTDVNWIIENTGRAIKITTEHDYSVFATFKGSNKRHYVDFMLLKWGSSKGSGSEHTFGKLSLDGELQIFHHPTGSNGERHAVSFMLEEREDSFVNNENWESLLSHIRQVQEPDSKIMMEAPNENIMTLLADTARGQRHEDFNYFTETSFRYKGSLPHPPCTENVIWTVHNRPINLSFYQFNTLRRLHKEGSEMRGNFARPRLLSGNVRPSRPQSPRNQLCYFRS